MEYKKPTLKYEQQLDLLITRGLVVKDRLQAAKLLSQIGYYRLSAYRIPFQNETDKFKSGTTFEDIYYLYIFDRELRFFVLQNLETIEIAFRSFLTYELSHKHGPFGYIDASNFSPSFKNHAKWLEDAEKEISRSRETFIDHYSKKYHSMKHLPLWMASETFSFNSLSRMYAGLKNEDKKLISQRFQLKHGVFNSWSHTLCYVRNVCAHHGRLWNKQLAIAPLIPEHIKDWHAPEEMDNKRLFATLTIMNYLISRLERKNEFKSKLRELLNKYPAVDIKKMGFVDHWDAKCPIWNM